ncbi:MAG TPA: YbjQ family protein [Pseudidiomarina sp.]|nr:YbjQ family protein [Pseudidiomarina sp.]
MSSILIVTTESVTGRTIKEHLGLVRGNTIRARHIGRDILAVFRNIVGGEIHDYTKLLGESREQALDRMADEARELGADAIVGVRFSTSMLAHGAAELLAYGTAVTFEKPSQ